MYVKRYVVQRGRKRYVYLRLVEAYRDEHGSSNSRANSSSLPPPWPGSTHR